MLYKQNQPLYLISHLKRLEKTITSSNFHLIMLDYDGTLSPIASTPEEARIFPGIKDIIIKLNKRGNVHIFIISGRSLKDLKSRIGIKGIFYAGNHGLEIIGQNITYTNERALKVKTIISDLCRKLEKELRNINGILVENKSLTASIHYRKVRKKEVKDVKEIISENLERKKDLILRKGKKVIEIRPSVDWDKGDAVNYFISRMSVEEIDKKTNIVYVGDDKTDEDAFSVFQHKGISVVVSDKKEILSKAYYFLKNPKEVRSFLAWLEEKIT